MRLLRVANVSNYLECSETEKMATDILNTPSFKLQKEEVLCIYKHIFKPLFEKKSLSKLYSKLVPMVVWVVMVNPCDSAGESVVFDICKKINIFLLYDKTKEDKIEPIKVFNLCLRLLSLKPDRGEAIQLRNLSCILNYFSEVNLSKYVETWRQAKNKYSAAEIENVFRNLLKSGCIKFYLSVIYEITLQLKESGDYKTLYHLFTRFIRADFASSKCMPQLEKYLRIL